MILLDTVVKNCGEKVHQAAAHPDFVAVLLDLAGKKIKSKYIKVWNKYYFQIIVDFVLKNM